MSHHDRPGHHRELTVRQWEEIAGPLEEATWDTDEDPLAPARGIFNGCLLGGLVWALIAFVLIGPVPGTQQGSPRKVTGKNPVVAQTRTLCRLDHGAGPSVDLRRLPPLAWMRKLKLYHCPPFRPTVLVPIDPLARGVPYRLTVSPVAVPPDLQPI